MSFQISALSAKSFAYLSSLSNQDLIEQGVDKVIVDAKPGYPCRVSLEDGNVGETVFLLNYTHQNEQTPFKASHAIYVRENAKDCVIGCDVVPFAFKSRLLSVRAFNDAHRMIDADVVDGADVASTIVQMFEEASVSYLHLHFAKQGCFAAKVLRA